MAPKKWLILGLGWEIYKMSLENFMAPEKAVLKKKKKRERNYWMYVMRESQDSLEFLVAKPGTVLLAKQCSCIGL